MLFLYIGFVAFILGLLALDLGVFHRKAKVVTVRSALAWSAVWISLGLAFTVFVYFAYEGHWFGLGTHAHDLNDGTSAAVKYVTGFVLEKSLAVDNIFVIAMIFTFLRVPAEYQHRVLFWGIIGALLMRGTMIGVGAALVTQFNWILYVFGGFLIFTGIKMLVAKSEGENFENNVVVRLVRRAVPVTPGYHGQRLFVRDGVPKALHATPLFLALVLVELTDALFAVDSIPAIFAVTTDAFLVFTSNVFAILGLRTLYFALAGMMDRFKYLKVSLSVVLVMIGAKMLGHGWLKAWLGEHFNFYVLGAVAAIIAAGVIASLAVTRGRQSATTAL